MIVVNSSVSLILTVTVLFQMDFSSEILCLIVVSYLSLFVKSSVCVFCFYDFSTFSSVVYREEEESEEEGEDPALDSLSQAIAFQVSAQMYFKGEVSRLLYYLKPSIYLLGICPYLTPLLKSHVGSCVPQQARLEEEQHRRQQTAFVAEEAGQEASTSDDSKKPRIKKSVYFSDEEELSD